jgi:cytochrome c oxidase subunit II
MITQFAFTPSITTADMRLNEDVVGKVQRINALRRDKSVKLAAKGEEVLEPYEFDYILLCNKICGNNHYNMQMKIVVESQEDYDTWLATQPTFAEVIKK